MRVAVAGGTGVVGHHVVEVALRRGHDVVVLTRSEGVDLTTGGARTRGLGRRVVPVRVPGTLGKLLRSGGLIPTSDGPRGRMTFTEWLGSG